MDKNNNKTLIKRFERKWLFENSNIDTIKIAILRSKLLFNEIYTARTVNSLYFDDCKFSSIIQNLDGLMNKVKYRIRWYGNKNIILKPQLEIKSKKGFISSKETINLDIEEKIYFNFEGLNKIKKFIYKHKKDKINLQPVLSTHYYRNYFLSSNKNIRATLDSNLCSSLLYGFTNYDFKRNFNKTILEFKYNQEFDNYVRKNLNNISPRISRSSKYIISAMERPTYFSYSNV